jgi:glycosyltransferase involved in cell wall biosynthesis
MSATIGIAIPAYGRGRHLRQTLESALNQTRPAYEIVVVDDCSPDETGEVAKSFEERGVKYFQNPANLGVPANYNESLGKLSTDYVMILEDHDVLEPTFIEECAAILDENAGVTLVACWIAIIDEKSGKTLEIFRPSFDRVQDGRKLAEYLVTHVNAPLCLTAMIRRSSLIGIEQWFDSKYWWYADINLWIKLAHRGKFGFVSKALLNMRRRESGHFLIGKEWEGLVCCDRIRKDNWASVFQRHGVESTLKWAKYSVARDYEAMKILLSRLARGDRHIPRDASEMFSPLGRMAARTFVVLPVPCARAIRAAHHVLVPRRG